MRGNSAHCAPDTLGISRRAFVAWSSVLGAAAVTTGCAPKKKEAPAAASSGALGQEPFAYDKAVWSGCHVNCGSRCPLRLYVKDGAVVRVGNDNEGSDDFGPNSLYQMRSCVRGRTVRQSIYNETRLQKPLKRVEGTKRGEGKYVEISWDQAISEISQIMKDVKEEFGNDAFFIMYGTGQLGGTISKSWHPDKTMFARLMNCWGGYLRHYSDYSTGQITWELPLLNGDAWSNNEVTDLVNSKNIVLVGNNPANTRMSGSAMAYLISWVRKNNPQANIVVIDPHLSDTAVGVANRWVPIRPGTDAALIAGMIHYLMSAGKLSEALIREKFVGFYSDSFSEDVRAAEPRDASFMGFDATGELTVEGDLSYEAYLKGTGGYAGTGEKTPEWAAGITGVPADTIRQLADLFVDGPTATIQGWGPQRHSNGGNSARAIGLIAAITGNVGISGGGTGAREATGGVGYKVPSALPCFPQKNTVPVAVSFFDWYQAIEDYRSMNDATWGVRYIDDKGVTSYAKEPGEIKLRAPIKFIWNYASNVMCGQHADINECLRLFNLPDTDEQGLRCVVTCDIHLTPTALVSDYILPGTTSFEETDVIQGGAGWTGYVCCESPAIDPMFDAKPVYEVCTLLSEKLGVKDEFTEGRTQEQWVEWLYDQGKAAGADLPATFAEFKEQGLFKQTNDHAPAVPDHAKMATPSGRYEVFSKQAYNLSRQWDLTCGGYVPDDGLDRITALPIWYEAPESYGDEATRAQYPLQLIGHHVKTRTHSSYGNVAWLKSVAPQQCWINDRDAAQRGIANGDEVLISTKRGKVRISAKVTSRIMPGVVSLPQGAWYDPESRDPDVLGSPDNIDRGGCISVLTSMRPTPVSKGNGVHSNLCTIEKA
ncbi:molybdopterin-dependent oxidoreductase [Eggerthellaceae bacterium zg-1084]|uniref:DMSO/selenate family reductase complex A subunit n=1 Tax=Berryella wangjianweii TaxID=2734634 RepID=UPI0015541EBC|nr:DMSO/selenate family reductase complex A subunit [Berryella wangjianweii]NPD30695.1 molybdopterin-dependent oxidoreductase [Berryella wangjianweii]